MHNPYTEAEQQEYNEVMHERWLEKQRQMREDAMDCFDVGGDDE